MDFCSFIESWEKIIKMEERKERKKKDRLLNFYRYIFKVIDFICVFFWKWNNVCGIDLSKKYCMCF